jgi:anti-sigma28 factor (negative regulator of flagellin synthesis)
MLMKINGGTNGPVRPDAKRDERIAVANKTLSGDRANVRTDTVEISDAGRAKAAEAMTAPDARAERLQAVRERILKGAYDTDEVVGEVARRILDRRDLQVAPPSDSQ